MEIFMIFIYIYIYEYSCIEYSEASKPKTTAWQDFQQRHNIYDGVEEFWITVKETGKRQESHSYEELQEKRTQARKYIILAGSMNPRISETLSGNIMFSSFYFSDVHHPCLCLEATVDPKFELGEKFKSIEASSSRETAEKDKAAHLGVNAESKFGQDRSHNSLRYIDSRTTSISIYIYMSIYVYINRNCSICHHFWSDVASKQSLALIDKRSLQEVYGQCHAESWKAAFADQRPEEKLSWWRWCKEAYPLGFIVQPSDIKHWVQLETVEEHSPNDRVSPLCLGLLRLWRRKSRSWTPSLIHAKKFGAEEKPMDSSLSSS